MASEDDEEFTYSAGELDDEEESDVDWEDVVNRSLAEQDAVSLRYRLTYALDPLLVRKGKAFESSFKQRPTKRRRAPKVANKLLKRKASSESKEGSEEETGSAHRVYWQWCEVLDEKKKEWIHVDAEPEDEEKALAQEEQKLETLKLAEGMPSSLEGFKKHHLQYFFVRTYNHCSPLLSGAVSVESSGRVNVRNLPSGSQEVTILETTEFESPSLVDGCVPKNQYGNIEIWSPAHIPKDAVHLRLPRIDTIAESLGIDFAPAVVGFETRNGRTMPKVSGIVVARAHEATLLDAHAERQQQTIEKAIAHNQKLVLKRWQKLTKRLLLRQRLENDYGAV
eukprot:jgi/Phyca11/533537/estExt2_fgenesh1_pg.C_PHYCAscaffold_140132